MIKVPRQAIEAVAAKLWGANTANHGQADFWSMVDESTRAHWIDNAYGALTVAIPFLIRDMLEGGPTVSVWGDIDKVNRVEVIDNTGRAYVKYTKKNSVSVSRQDDGETLKVFIKELDEIQARVEDCVPYNFGMYTADKLAHEDAPKLIAALEAIETLANSWSEEYESIDMSCTDEVNDRYTRQDALDDAGHTIRFILREMLR